MTLQFILLMVVACQTQQPYPAAQPAVQNPALREELVKRMKAEQDARTEWIRLNPSHKPLSSEELKQPEMKAAMENMEKIDKENLAWLKSVVDRHGWPGKSVVGKEGAQGAFLIAQHAVSDLEFMSKCLGMLKEAYKTGDAEGQWVALMTDRLLILKDKKQQLYGSQLVFKDGKLVPQPIEDEPNVDKRRKELGMPPLAEYLKMVNERSKEPSPSRATPNKK